MSFANSSSSSKSVNISFIPGIAENLNVENIKLVMESPKLGKTSQIWLQGFDALMRFFFTPLAKVSWKLSSLFRASRRDARGHVTSSHGMAAPTRHLLRTSVLLKAGPRGTRSGENCQLPTRFAPFSGTACKSLFALCRNFPPKNITFILRKPVLGARL